MHGTPLYSCHTLATEAAGRKILTVEGVGDEKNLHPLQGNAPKLQRPNVARGRILPEPLLRELNLQGETVAIVVAETEDLAQDAADAIKVEYEVLPFASLLKDSMAPSVSENVAHAGHLRGGRRVDVFASTLRRRSVQSWNMSFRS